MGTTGNAMIEKTIGIYLFEGFEELDALGPWEVLASWTQQHPDDGWSIRLVADTVSPVRAAKGAVITPHETREIKLDVVIVPGGDGSRTVMHDGAVLDWLRELNETGVLVASVCTGALVLASAGLLSNRPATTYFAAVDELRAVDSSINVLPHERWVDDDDIVTSAGISAGIDMALHLVDRLAGTERARQVRRHIQYDPAPPV